jgi:glycosyltransferase involved in cell wall biosynthesis
VLPTTGLVAVLSAASRATAVAVRWLEEEPADIVHVEGWSAAPTALALHTTHALPAVSVVTPRDVAPGDGPDDAARHELVDALAALGPVLLRGTAPDALPHGTDLPSRRPGPPPAAGPVLLVPAPGVSPRAAAAALRARLGGHRVGTTTRRRPVVVAVTDPHAVDAALRGLARGVPVVAVRGGEAATVVARAGGLVVDDDTALADAVARLLADPDGRATLGAAAAAHARTAHGWPVVAAAWARAAASAGGRRGPGGPRPAAASSV